MFPCLEFALLDFRDESRQFYESYSCPMLSLLEMLPSLPSGPMSGFCFIEKVFASHPVWPILSLVTHFGRPSHWPSSLPSSASL